MIVNPDTVDESGVLMPAAFIGHGNPMNALEVNRYTTAWQAFEAAVRHSRRQCTLVHQCDCRHGHVQAADDPRLLRIPAGVV